MRATVALPVTTKNISQLGSRFSCCPPMIARQHGKDAFQSGNLKRSRGFAVAVSLGWRICK
jgi:hypothetical protein